MKWVYITLGFIAIMMITSYIGKYQDTHIVKPIHAGAQP